jgi:hypothetical protein
MNYKLKKTKSHHIKKKIVKVLKGPIRIFFRLIFRIINVDVEHFKNWFLRNFYKKEIENGDITLNIVSSEEKIKFKDHYNYIIIGPWMSEIGFELLYWIPLLQKKYNFENKKIIVISRGGVSHWYSNLKVYKYLNVQELIKDDDFKDFIRVKAQIGEQKQTNVENLESKIYEIVMKKFSISAEECKILHPRIMYNYFRPYWNGSSKMNFSALQKNITLDYPKKLNMKIDIKNFVVCKLYSSSILYMENDKEKYLQKISLLMNIINQRYKIVFLNYNSGDDHKLILPSFDEKLKLKERYYLDDLFEEVDKDNNLEIQNFLVSRSEFFFGTYGGFSYLPSYYQKNSITLKNNNQKLIDRHQPVFDASKKNKLEIIDLKIDDLFLKKQINFIIDNFEYNINFDV